ncbi:hypothetical protein [Chitinophaga rhizophila]|uniref:Uncharacterized protein n=1 Tax=Chitinophaga rhizophila TaxID=2866212 RepID=A0ABS7G751_9BACT|nr:hypothetical protein [Chitinophaga rhizophila]MBW8683470.1 hypothetical protein [Chitinophaga rhizophila]
MKKAKLILSGIALFAIVGGAFAFKANRGAGNLFKPGATTVINGSTYYMTSTLGANFSESTSGPATLYYRTATILGGTYVLSIPTTTAAITVAP